MKQPRGSKVIDIKAVKSDPGEWRKENVMWIQCAEIMFQCRYPFAGAIGDRWGLKVGNDRIRLRSTR